MKAGVSRRALLIGGAIYASSISRLLAAAPVQIEQFDAMGASTGVEGVDKVVKTDAEWRAGMSPLAYEVTRREGTERAFTGPFWDDHADGLYRCVGCGTALFDSKTKFDSGTGWPSFFAPISKRNVIESDDRSMWMRRTAVSCARCDAHLGHVFSDGPKPTGLRYCINGVALTFAPRGGKIAP